MNLRDEIIDGLRADSFGGLWSAKDFAYEFSASIEYTECVLEGLVEEGYLVRTPDFIPPKYAAGPRIAVLRVPDSDLGPSPVPDPDAVAARIKAHEDAEIERALARVREGFAVLDSHPVLREVRVSLGTDCDAARAAVKAHVERATGETPWVAYSDIPGHEGTFEHVVRLLPTYAPKESK